MFWKDLINLTIRGSSRYFIDTCIDKGFKNVWRFIGFYGELETSRQIEAWNCLRRLKRGSDIPWLCVGYFNELVSQDEKLGDALYNRQQKKLFKVVINECGFMDLGFIGSRFTWSKHLKNGNSI